MRLLVGLFSSVWFGIVLLSLIFIYSSIGSAYPPARQHWRLEMTEFQFFNWWVFDLLIFLLVTTLITVTLRKIRFNAINLGVWMIHTGIVVLALGSAYYFGTKLEGDTPIFRRQLVIDLPGQDEPLRMVVRPGNRVEVTTEAGRYAFEVANIQPEYMLRSEGFEGQRAYAVTVSVQTPDQRFFRQVHAGYPQFTEDVVPGKGRAIKTVGTKLLVPEDQLRIALDYEPQEYFYLQDTAALYVRPVGSNEWDHRPIENLPHYHDRFSSRDEVWMPLGEPVPVRPIDLPVPPSADGDALADYDVYVTGYLRYAFPEERWTPGGSHIYPVCNVSLIFDDGSAENVDLVAFDPSRSRAKGGVLAFRWVESVDELDELTGLARPMLDIHIPETQIALHVPAVAPEGDIDQAEFQAIEGTDYSFRIRNVVNDLNVPVDGGSRSLSVVIVEVRHGERTYRRWVATPADFTRDLAADGSGALETDSGIQMTYRPGNAARLTVVAGPAPVGVRLLQRDAQGDIQPQDFQPGQVVSVRGGLKLRLNHLYPRARAELRPAIEPQSRRQRDAGKSYSQIKVVLAKDGWSTSTWLPYNHYAVPSEQYRYPGRINYSPVTIDLPDGTSLELMYSRQRHKLPAPVALDDFTLQTHQGGLIGTNSNVRDYVSQLRFADASGQWGPRKQMSSNHPANYQGFWFFQSSWDPPTRGSAGMNFTGTGVGNRNGVYIQLVGCCIAVTGMIYAFYYKPILIRRGRRAAELKAAARMQQVQNSLHPEELQSAPVG